MRISLRQISYKIMLEVHGVRSFEMIDINTRNSYLNICYSCQNYEFEVSFMLKQKGFDLYT